MVKKAACSLRLSSGPAAAGCGACVVGAAPSDRLRMRQADNRISGRSSPAVSTVSTSSIRRPGRRTDDRSRTGPTGTGAKMS
ncbi:hypothetical protein [Blastococcus brunescens]|uniref:Secreted protein n=1 Tax=Blastococcus brunescens TaxID=1564165 RepID=A0ABZ1AZV8_9ACTN|nr:hypothetical protein [Blastococcus sp. BMG 8361]WRL63471.1 hypothetical protein U6N30_27760 [Blastococcus sp. BMG 8361]